MQHQPLELSAPSTLLVFAEKVQQMQLAKNNYLKNLKASPEVKKDALKELQKVESEVDTLLYAILHKPETAERVSFSKKPNYLQAVKR